MTVIVQQLQEKIQDLDPSAVITVNGASGEEYPIKGFLVDGNHLHIQIQDELDDVNGSDEDDDDSDDE